MPRWSPGSTLNPRDRMRPTPTAGTGAWSSALGASRPGSRWRGAVRAGCGPKTIRGWPARSARSYGAGCRRRFGRPAAPGREVTRQRLEPLAKALGASSDGEPTAGRLIVLPSPAMAGIPIEALLAENDTRTVSYAPSGTLFKYLREQARPNRHAGLLAVGDPIYERARQVERPQAAARPWPAGQRRIAWGKRRVTWSEAGRRLAGLQRHCISTGRMTSRPLPMAASRLPLRCGETAESYPRELAPGKLGVVIDARPAPEAIAANRAIAKLLVAARSGDEDFAPLPGTRYEALAIARLFKADDRPSRTLLGTDASELELDRLAASGELGRFGFIHLATHGVIDEAIPQRSAVILTQTDLPDPLTQVLNRQPAFDGRLSVREIQRGWNLKAELVTLSACETALGHQAGGEGFVGFTQALLMSGTRSVCLSLWKVDDTATALLMQRFYANLLGRRGGLAGPMPKAQGPARGEGLAA